MILSSYLSSIGYANDLALTRLLQTSFLFLVALPVLVVFYSFLFWGLPDIVHLARVSWSLARR